MWVLFPPPPFTCRPAPQVSTGLGMAFVGPEHLLLALLAAEDSGARRLLARCLLQPPRPA